MSEHTAKARSTPLDHLRGFIAAFFATLIFHQLAVALLWNLCLASGPPFQFAPRPPFGVPAVISLAFWGAILPSLVALLIVVPLKGGPVGTGWMAKIWIYAFLVNGSWFNLPIISKKR